LQLSEQLVWVWAVHFLACWSNRIQGEDRVLRVRRFPRIDA
jgi:hypothetical protein